MANARGPLRLYYFTFYASLAVYLPYFPSWLKQHGVEGLSMSALMCVLPVMNVVGPPGFGLLADTLGWRGRLLRWAATGAAVSFLPLLVYVALAHSVTLWVLLATCLGFAFFRTPMMLMADVVALEQGEDFSRLRLWGSLGFMLAVPIVGRWLDLTLLWAFPLLMAALLWAAQVTTRWMPDQGRVPRRSVLSDLWRVLEERGLAAFAGAVVFGQAAHVGYDLVLSMHLRDLGMSGTFIGLAWAIATASEIVVMAYAPRFLTSVSAPWLLLAALVVQCARWCLMSLVHDHTSLLLLQTSHALSFGLRWVASMQIVAGIGNRVGALASVQGMHLTASSIGSVAGMFIAGSLYQSYGGSRVFAASAMLAATGAIFAFVHGMRVLQAGRLPPGGSTSRA